MSKKLQMEGVTYLEESDFNNNGDLIADIPKDMKVVIMIQADFCIWCKKAKPEFIEFAKKFNMDSSWETHCFEANPIVFAKSKDTWKALENEGHKIIHYNLEVSDKNEKIKVNCAYSFEGDYVHLGSNILKNPPEQDIRHDDAFNYKNEEIIVDAIKFSDRIKRICSPDDFVVLKLDIEGSEFAVLDDIIETKTYELLDEIYIEFHERFFENIDYYKNKILEYKKFFKGKGIMIKEDGLGEVWDL